MPTTVKSRLAGGPRRARLPQWIRAVGIHIRALLREFRAPIVGFLAVTVGGGILYGEVYRWVRGEFIPFIDRPYITLQLMLLEAPEAVPPELSLAVFWYAFPVAFIVLVGFGTADFLDLFFNREEHRDRWGEALSMTYRRHAIVLGAGHVGLRVIRDLRDMGEDVAVIDQSPSIDAQDVLQALSVPLVMGDAHSTETLKNAGLDQAAVFVACTGDDKVNLETVMKVREMNPRIRIVARVWDRGLGKRMEQFGIVDTVMSAADLSAPAFAGAALGVEITQTLQVGGEEYSTARLTVEPGSFLAGASVGALEEANEIEVVLVGATVDPPLDTVLSAGEDVVIFARHHRVLEVVTRNRKR